MGKPIELSEFTQQRLKQVGFLSDAFEQAGIVLNISRERYPSLVKVSIENDFNKHKDVDTLLYATSGPTPELAAKMNRAISDHLISIHTKALHDARAICDREVGEWQSMIDESRHKISMLETNLEHAARGESMDTLALFLNSAKLQEQRSILVQMTQMKHKIFLESHNPIISFPTETASEVRVPQRAYFPRLSLVLAALVFLVSAGWLFLCWLEFNVRECLS